MEEVGGLRVFITGSAGGVGAILAELCLAQGWQVLGFDIRDGGACETRIGNILDEAQLRQAIAAFQPDRVVHLAGLLGAAAEDGPGINLNNSGFINTAFAARELDVSRMVFASSKAVYAPIEGRYASPTLDPLPETYPVLMRNGYSATKLFQEGMAAVFRERDGMDIASIRFGTYYGPSKNPKGPRVPGLMASGLIGAAMSGGPVVLESGGDQRMDLTYVVDGARAVVALCAAPKLNHSIYHAGSGKLVTLGDLGREIAPVFPGVKVSIGGGLDPVGGGEYCLYDNSRIHADTGYEPRFDLAAGLADFVRRATAAER